MANFEIHLTNFASKRDNLWLGLNYRKYKDLREFKSK